MDKLYHILGAFILCGWFRLVTNKYIAVFVTIISMIYWEYLEYKYIDSELDLLFGLIGIIVALNYTNWIDNWSAHK